SFSLSTLRPSPRLRGEGQGEGRSNLGHDARLGGEAEDAAPIEAETLILGLAAHIANVDLLDDHGELEGGEDLVPADRADIEAGARGIALDRLGPAREAVAPGRHRRDLAPG